MSKLRQRQEALFLIKDQWSICWTSDTAMNRSLVVKVEFRLTSWLILCWTNLNLKLPMYFALWSCHLKMQFLVSLVLTHAFPNRAVKYQTLSNLNNSGRCKHVQQNCSLSFTEDATILLPAGVKAGPITCLMVGSASFSFNTLYNVYLLCRKTW